MLLKRGSVGVLHPHCGSLGFLDFELPMTSFVSNPRHGKGRRAQRRDRSRDLPGLTMLRAWFGGPNARFYLLSLWLVLIFLMGGTSRPDTESLLFLRPASVIVAGAGLWTLRRDHIMRLRGSFLFVAAIVSLIVVHLVPLPPAVWTALPGRGLIYEIDQALGQGGIWRPLSMAPPWTWHALWFMFIPLSVLVHAAQLSYDQVRKLGTVVLLIGLAGGVLAIAQVLGDPRGLLFPYRVSHFGLAIGLFANRNHQAVFLATLVPIALMALRRNRIKVRFDQKSSRRVDVTNLVVLILVAALFPLVLASGSRAGLTALIVSVVMSLVVLPPFADERDKTGATGKMQAKRRHKAVGWTLLSVIAGLAVTGLAFRNDRAVSIDRILVIDPLEDLRTKILPTAFAMTRLYAPLGSGVGTFEPVYQIHEPDDLLFPVYANHVHNDWLEVAMTAGVPGILLLGWAIGAWGLAAFVCLRRQARRERLNIDLVSAGLIVTLVTALASISDYPLRTPAFGALFMIMIVWINFGLSKLATVPLSGPVLPHADDKLTADIRTSASDNIQEGALAL